MLRMNDNTLVRSDTVQTGAEPADQLVFVGSRFAFPDMLLRFVGGELEGVGTRRIDPGQIGDLPGARLLVFEENLGERLIDAPPSGGSTPIRAVAYRDPHLARRLMQRQQAGEGRDQLRFLPIGMPVETLVSLLRILLSGDILVPAELLGPQGGAGLPPPDPAAPATETLTPREMEVLHLAARGQRNKVIANALGVSEHTIKLHIHHIIAKIGVANRTEAAGWYLARPGQRS